MIDREQEAQLRRRRAVEQMTDHNRLAQLRAAQQQTAEAWTKLITTHERGVETPEDKRRYTLAYNGLRRLLKKTLHFIV